MNRTDLARTFTSIAAALVLSATFVTAAVGPAKAAAPIAPNADAVPVRY